MTTDDEDDCNDDGDDDDGGDGDLHQNVDGSSRMLGHYLLDKLK